MRADLRKIANILPGVDFDALCEMFNAADRTRASMVGRDDFVRGISEQKRRRSAAGDDSAACLQSGCLQTRIARR